jgi:hypothetical protein
MPPRVFLSHVAEDARLASSIAEHIKTAGVLVYSYEHDLQPGRSIADKIKRAIADSDALVVLLTRNSQYSAYVQHEVGCAEGMGKPILPLTTGDYDLAHMAMLVGRECIPLDPQLPDRSIMLLLQAIASACPGFVPANHPQHASDREPIQNGSKDRMPVTPPRATGSPTGAVHTDGTTSIPDLAGLTAAGAKEALAARRRELAVVGWVPSDKQEEGHVLTQAPSAGSMAPPGQQVLVTLSKGTKRHKRVTWPWGVLLGVLVVVVSYVAFIVADGWKATRSMNGSRPAPRHSPAAGVDVTGLPLALHYPGAWAKARVTLGDSTTPSTSYLLQTSDGAATVLGYYEDNILGWKRTGKRETERGTLLVYEDSTHPRSASVTIQRFEGKTEITVLVAADSTTPSPSSRTPEKTVRAKHPSTTK